MSTVRNIARVARRAMEEAEPHRGSLLALILPAEPVGRRPTQPNPWAETLAAFLIVAVIALGTYMFAIGVLLLVGHLGSEFKDFWR
jgi:hypothetical protein